MGFYGGDTDAMRTVADQFRDDSKKLDDLRDKLDARVNLPMIWHGPDAEDFREKWRTQAYGSMEATAEALRRRADDLEDQAKEQDLASDRPGFWDFAKIGLKAVALYKSLKGIISHGKDMARILSAWRAKDLGRVRDIMQSLKLRNYMKLGSEGFGKLFKFIGGKLGPGGAEIGKWLGNKIDALPDLMAKGGKLASKIGGAVGPKALEFMSKASKFLGKAVPFLDIGTGIAQFAGADDGYGKVSGGLSVAGGALMLAGTVFPPAAAVGAVLSGVSLGMDLVDLAGEKLFGTDVSKVVSEKVGEAVSVVKDKVGGFFGGVGKKLGSIFG